ncbi:hypothetical protein PHYSODRAFT_306371 [Phytophthora sojae]|uniref:Ankyrin repeat protein n=1 Tax=Phytophthora sojae (strain P6497) TaxID=1094619 RepID=G5A996_PHYSP|nr:hypothetical protein PHYSODRAFT_306371 [Phytophthora sojae]EGZ08472.1 hypothetical protein PHYSODRAFT_306371 [Phytophthora sojae]|eukprot:XP_009536644.1 hypothetical protein PHYSODRAFT_306371 [Phytophthora sojae]
MENSGQYREDEEDDGDEDDEEDYLTWEAKRDAAVAAAGNGHLVIVECIIPENVAHEYDSDDEDTDHLHSSTRPLDHAKDEQYWHRYDPSGNQFCALARASAGGHSDVVNFLLSDRENCWNIARAFEKAAVAGNDVVASTLYHAYSRREKEDLFVRMVTAGSANAVKYLHKNHFVDSSSFEAGFYAAIAHEWTDIIEFLLSTEEVSTDLFDKAFALVSRIGKLKSAALLHGKKRASPQATIDAFETGGSLAVVKFLYSNEHVPVSSIIAAFTNASRYGTTPETIKSFSSELSEESTKIVCFLYTLNGIPSGVISEAFNRVATKIPLDVAGSMCTEHSISSAAIGAAFVSAVADRQGLGFLKFLAGQGSIEQKFLGEAFPLAARFGRKRTLLVMYGAFDWSQSILTEALRETRNRRIKKVLRMELKRQSNSSNAA